MGYADSLNIPFVALVGDSEMQENKITLKNMGSGEQQKLTFDDLLSLLLA